ncbi:MAG: septum formation initiator family protein [Victivallaceae bacterium]|nr:septum formation initiator family protein [Victivallaceae bacterium]
MNHEIRRTQRWPWYLLLVLVIGSLIALIPSFIRLKNSNRNLVKTEHELDEKLRERDRSMSEVEELKTPRGVERVARERFHMAREGETVYEVKKENPQQESRK